MINEHPQLLHSKVGASQAHRFVKCTASVDFIESLNLKKEEVNEQCKLGTQAHEHAFNYFTDDVPIPAGFEALNDHIAYVEQYRRADSIFFLEQKVSYNNVLEEGFGTLDLALINADTLHVFDLKYGYTRVFAESNYQLILYTIGMMNTFKHLVHNVTQFEIHISQPLIQHFDSHKFDLAELEKWKRIFKDVDDEIRNYPRFKTGDHCNFCPALSQCKTAINSVVDSFDKVNNTAELEDKLNLLRQKSIYDKMIESISTEIKTKLKEEAIYGVKLRDGRRMKTLIPNAQEEIKKILGDRYESVLKSTIDIDKLENLIIEEQNDELKNLIQYTQASPTLVFDKI